MELLEATLKRFDIVADRGAASQEVNPETVEIISKGVEVFERASDEVTPMTRLMVGVRYCLRALEEWRLYGPAGKSQNVRKEESP